MMNELMKYPVLAFLVIVAGLLIAGLIIYGLMRFGEAVSRLYWKRILAEGARLAREHPEWLAEAIIEHEVKPSESRELARVTAFRQDKALTVETAPRKDLEAYAHRLEGALVEMRRQVREMLDEHGELQHRLNWALDWKGKHWRRIQRIDEAVRNDNDVFAALHPRLAREQAP